MGTNAKKDSTKMVEEKVSAFPIMKMAQIESAVFDYALETNFITSGDLNSDNIINNEDIDILVNLILAGEYIFISDFNLDNKLDILDLLELVEIIIS